MQTYRRWLPLLLPAALLAVTVCPATGQDADADPAQAMLRQGIEQFENYEFKAARQSFLEVDPGALPADERDTLEVYLRRSNQAILNQAAAIEAYRLAQEALEGGNLEQARDGFRRAAASEYISPETRRQAARQLATLQQRLDAQQEAEPEPDTQRSPEPTPSAESAANDQPEAVTDVPDGPRGVPQATPRRTRPVEEPLPLVTPPTEPEPQPEPQEQPPASPAAPRPVDTTTPGDDEAQVLSDRQRSRQALELVRAGNEALDDNQPDLAAALYERALQLDPDLPEAQRQLEVARDLTTGRGKPPVLTRLQRNMRIAREIADVEFANALQRSREILATADSEEGFASAESFARVAQNTIEQNRRLYTPDEYRQRMVQIEEQFSFIETKREVWERTQVAREAEEVTALQRERERREARAREQRISSLREQTRALTEERRFADALNVVDRILQLDPTDEFALDRRTLLQTFVLTTEERELIRERKIQEHLNFNEIRKAEIPWYELLRYPSRAKWQELTRRRQPFRAAGVLAETEEARRHRERADRLLRQNLSQVLPEVDYQETSLGLIIADLRQKSGANIVPRWPMLQTIGVTRDTPVTIELEDVTVERALREILAVVPVALFEEAPGQFGELDYIIQDGIVRISTRADLQTVAYEQIYDIRDLIYRVPNFAGPRVDVLGLEGAGGADAGGIGGDIFEAATDETERREAEIPTREEMINRLTTVLVDQVDPTSWSVNGGTIGAVSEWHGQLVVRQTAENHERISRILNGLREARALQISIEARFIEVRSSFLNSVGLDLDVAFNIDSGLGGGGSVIDPFTGLNVPVQGASGWGGNRPRDFTPIAGRTNLVPGDTGGFSSQRQIGFANMVGRSSPGFTNLDVGPALSVAGTFLSDIQVDFLVEATQAHEQTRQLTSPRITLWNGQRAYVVVAEMQAYVADLEPEVEEQAVAFDPTVGYIPTGTVLDVEGTVSADRRYVTLTIRPQIAQLNELVQFPVIASEIDDEGNVTEGRGFLQLPNVTIQDLQTTVSVPDGGTLLLGGQKLSGERSRELGAPILSKVPVINRAFTNRGDVRDESTLLILVKPEIIIQREREEELEN